MKRLRRALNRNWVGKYGWQWYSICSAHQIYDFDCELCQRGKWHGPISQFNNRRWHRRHWFDGNKWREGKKPPEVYLTANGYRAKFKLNPMNEDSVVTYEPVRFTQQP